MLARVLLLRHGEVDNPGAVVYASLPGFPLSEIGRLQARQAGDHLASLGPDLLRCSPLDRAIETAAAVSTTTGLEVVVDPRLTEWGLATRWSGQVWDAVDPAELAAYHQHPDDLPFSPEQAGEMARRMMAVVDELGKDHPGSTAVLVTHQDPMQALRLHLTGLPLRSMMQDKPGHCEVVTLEPAEVGWAETARWRPAARSSAFPPPA